MKSVAVDKIDHGADMFMQAKIGDRQSVMKNLGKLKGAVNLSNLILDGKQPASKDEKAKIGVIQSQEIKQAKIPNYENELPEDIINMKRFSVLKK